MECLNLRHLDWINNRLDTIAADAVDYAIVHNGFSIE